MFHNLLLLIWIPGCQTHATNFTYFQLDRGTRNISQEWFTFDYCRFLNNTVCKRYFGEIEGYAKKPIKTPTQKIDRIYLEYFNFAEFNINKTPRFVEF